MKKLFTLLAFVLSLSAFSQSADGLFKTVTASGTNTYTISDPNPNAVNYDSKEKWIVTFTNASTGNVTLNRATIGAKAVRDSEGTQLASGDILAGQRLLLSYNGTYYQVVGGTGGGGDWGDIEGTLSDQTDLQAALDAKQASLVSGTNIKTVESTTILGSGNIDITATNVGLGNVDNTSDVNKPVSTAQQGLVVQTITNGVTTSAPSQDAAFDALALKQAGSANLTALSTLGSALQQIRVDAAGTAYEFITPVTYPLTTTGDMWYSSDNSGTPARRGIGANGEVLTVSAGLPVWSAAAAAGWALTGTSTFTGPVTIAQAGNTLTSTTTLGFGTTTATLRTITNNGSEVYNWSTNGISTHKLYNTSGTELGRVAVTTPGSNIGLRLSNSGATAHYDIGFHPTSGYLAIYHTTIASTQVCIGAGAAIDPSATLQVRGAGTTTSSLVRFEDSAGNSRFFLDDGGTNGRVNASIYVGGNVTPTARLHLAAGTTTASTGSMKLTEGVNPTSAEDGVVNYVANNITFTETSTVYTLAKTLTNTATLNFDLTAVNSEDLTITVTGAATGDAVSIALDAGSVPADITYFGWVSATNTVSIRCSRVGGGGAVDPASGTFRASVIHY